MKVSLTNRWHSRGRSRGFTLVELLVVIAIIAALAALIFPAVQGARAASKRAASQANLRNIALALLTYESQGGAFPVAGRVPGDTKPRVGWITQVLPQLERKDLFSRYDFSKDWFAPENIAVTATQIPVLIDSASPQPERYDDRPESTAFASGTLNVSGPSVLVGITDYASIRSVDPRLFTGSGAGSTGTAGIDGPNATGGGGIGPTGTGSVPTGGTYASTKTLGAFVNASGNGIMPPNVKARLADVTDGLSHTILLAESHARPYYYRRGKKIETDLNIQRVNGGGWSRNANDIRLQGYNKDGSAEIGPYGINAANGTPVGSGASGSSGGNLPAYGTDGTGGIYSFHAGGAHVAFGDASVRFLSEKVDIAVLAALVTRDQNELVDDGEIGK